MKRASGVLVNVSSFPGEFGVGGFGSSAEHVLSMIAEAGFSWWQVLPITTIGWGNSPYSGVSTYAGNFLYISPKRLLDEGLITEAEFHAAKYKGQPYRADYAFAKQSIKGLLTAAYKRYYDFLSECEKGKSGKGNQSGYEQVCKNTGLNDKYSKIKLEIGQFEKENADWLGDYALYMAIADKHSVSWQTWQTGLKKRDPKALEKFEKENAFEIGFYVFEQYLFFKHWKCLKDFANRIGIKVLGDLPFYVADASVDVWANQELFMLKADGYPSGLAGVPPDYFAVDGQIWGNPVYNFEAMKKDDYSWWRKRISHALELYDGLRLDHFRGFSEYYVIPSPKVGEKPDARKGKWKAAPGQEILDFVKDDNKDAFIIAEDLGIIDEKVEKLVKWTGFPTMRVMQFAFESFDSLHLPHKFEKNMAVYTGTHDNNTTLGWLYETDENVRNYCFRYCGYNGHAWGAGGADCPSTRAIIKTLIASSADLAVVPVQDLAGYGADTRMNVPGVADENWEFRMHLGMLDDVDRAYFLEINNLYGRNIK